MINIHNEEFYTENDLVLENYVIEREIIAEDPLNKKKFENESKDNFKIAIKQNDLIEIKSESEDMEVINHHEKYNKKLMKSANWKIEAGKIFEPGCQVALYKDNDSNSETRKRAFDAATDGKIYDVIKVNENNFIDIANEKDPSDVVKGVDIKRVKLRKTK